MGNIHKDQRGLGAVVIVLIVVALAAVGGIGYFVYNKQKDKDSGNTSQSAEQKAAASAAEAACKAEANDEDFCKWASNYANALSDKVSYTATITGGEGTTVLKSDGKGNSYMSSETGEGKAEYITLAGTTYMKSPGSDIWYRFPKGDDTASAPVADSEQPSYDFTDTNDDTTPVAKTIYKNLGKEPCGSLTCIKFQTYEESTPGDTTTVWFDTKDYLTRKMEMVTAGSTSTIVYTYEAVTISEPSPVQDFTVPDYSIPSGDE